MFTTARGKRRFRWKASAIEKLHGHLMDRYRGDVSRTAGAQARMESNGYDDFPV